MAQLVEQRPYKAKVGSSSLSGSTAGGLVPELTEIDRAHLRRCVELAREALDAGDEPFGSVLADAGGSALAEGRNRVVETGDATQHPELELARWAAAHLTGPQRAAATVYTSGEHCPMCAAAHGWVGLGRIVYISSTAQLADWLAQAGAPAPAVATLPIQHIAPGIVVQGPVDELVEQVRALQLRAHAGDPDG
jgi:tRNA(Arg) A34 adenosine deaminase TadA